MSALKLVVGIAGASGAGKSVLADRLFDSLSEYAGHGKVAILNEDCYYRDQSHLAFSERELTNYDHPSSLEFELMAEHVNALRDGQTVSVPQYSFEEHTRTDTTRQIMPPEILIVEGILIFHETLIRDTLDLKVYVDVPMDICLSRRLIRDIEQRGRSLDSVLKQYHQFVRPMFLEFIQPTKSKADIIVPAGGENDAAIEILDTFMRTKLAVQNDQA